MRYTRVGTMSYVVTLLLLGVALGFAFWRSRPVPPPPVDRDQPRWMGEGQTAYAKACADCHPAAADLGGSGWSRSRTDSVIDLLLRGEARFVERGTVRVRSGHPDFGTLADSRLAAIVSFVAAGGAADRDAVPAVSAADVAARRSGPR